jgi:type II secretory pathway component PulF
LVNLVDRLPGTRGITRVLDAARICSMWRLFLGRGLPMQDALRAAALVVQSPASKAALLRVADRSVRGEQFSEAMLQESAIDPLIGRMLKYRKDDRILDSLAQMQVQYEQEVVLRTRDAAAAWMVVGIVMMTLAVVLLVVMVFVPVVKVYQPLQQL